MAAIVGVDGMVELSHCSITTDHPSSPWGMIIVCGDRKWMNHSNLYSLWSNFPHSGKMNFPQTWAQTKNGFKVYVFFQNMDVALQQRMINCKAAILGVNKITCVHPQKSIQSTIYLSCVTCIHLQLACLLGDVLLYSWRPTTTMSYLYCQNPFQWLPIHLIRLAGPLSQKSSSATQLWGHYCHFQLLITIHIITIHKRLLKWCWNILPVF